MKTPFTSVCAIALFAGVSKSQFTCEHHFPDGSYVDLTQLQRGTDTKPYHANDPANLLEFSVNVCGVVMGGTDNCSTSSSMACQYNSHGVYAGSVARWAQGQEPVWSQMGEGGLTGVVLTFVNGDQCTLPDGSKAENIAIFAFPCEPQITNANAISAHRDPASCTYKFVFPSPASCPRLSAKRQVAPNAMPGGGKAGWSMLSLFIFGVLAYCVGGCAYKWKKEGAVGIEALPHREFWVSLPSAVSEAYQRAIAMVKHSFSKVSLYNPHGSSASTQSYEQVQPMRHSYDDPDDNL